jgi:regulator of replication initiation timing
MSWLTDTLQGIPLNAVLREKISLVEQKLKDMELEKKKLEERVTELDKENSGLKTENANLKQQLATATTPVAKPQINKAVTFLTATRLAFTAPDAGTRRKRST